MTARILVFALGLWAIPLTGAYAQQGAPPATRLALEFQPGWVGFADDGIVGEGLAGGSLRLKLSPRVSAGPEVSYIVGDNHSHLVLTGNLTFDFVAPPSDRSFRVTPFAVVGAGLFRTTERFPQEDYSSSEGAFTVGGGVRAETREGFVAGFEARLGWETHVRLNAIIGYSF